MSRSYKKTPYAGDKKEKQNKRMANKKVRRDLKNFDIEYQGADYKRASESWNICDYYSIIPWEQHWMYAVNYWLKYGQAKGEPYPDEKKEYRLWKRRYKNK